MRNVLVGTASWTDATLIKSGHFYPPDAKTPEQRLRYYASQFPVVEVDSSFYALPSFNNSLLWTNRTHEHFVFDVKLFRAFTLHQTPLKSLPKALREEVEGLANRAGNVYYEDLPTGVRDELWRIPRGARSPEECGQARLPPGAAAALGHEEPRTRGACRGVSQPARRLPDGARVQERDLAIRAEPREHGSDAARVEWPHGHRRRAPRVRQ
jgi:hypothetical protein